MTYAARVTFTDHASTVVDVQTEADPDTGEGQEEAFEKAEDQLPGGLCHHCANEIELNGDWSRHSVENVTGEESDD